MATLLVKNPAEAYTSTQAISKKVAAQAISGEGWKGRRRRGGVHWWHQDGETALACPSPQVLGKYLFQTRSFNALGSYTQNSTNNPNRHKNVTRIEVPDGTDKEPLTCRNKQAEKSLTLTQVSSKHTEARTTNDITMMEKTG
mmetsp:Transcript_71899/g.116587  ORF Transcript_71899/g.116587 Transcript_71899/m.116587 type:complete len:142 (+) Transcript_71899:88-513(+)